MTEGFRSRPLDVPARRQPASRMSSYSPKQWWKKGKPSRGTIRERIVGAWNWIVSKKNELGWKRFLLRCAGIGVGLFVLYFGFLWLTLPNLDDPYNSLFSAAESTAIVDRNGVELYRVHGEQDRTTVKGSDIATTLKQAMVAIEDERFYERGCLDLRAMARAIFRFGQAGGASTITRQLARNALNLKNDSLINRKFKEIILGCELEHRYSKEDLLDLYLNWVPFGVNIYGVEQASLHYFNKHAKDLTLAESAVLASLPQRPSYFNPYGRHVHTEVSPEVLAKIEAGTITKAAQIKESQVSIGLLGGNIGTGSAIVYVGGRTDQVLHNLLDQKLIVQADYDKALQELTTLTFLPSRDGARAPYFVLWMKDQVEKLYEGTAESGLLEQGGLTIETTLDWRLQQIAEQAVAAHKDDVLKRFGAHNIALVALDPKTKEVLAYVGNTDYGNDTKEGKIDMAQVPRQPGSSFKPFVYAAAFEKGHGPATVLYDVPTKFGPYEPQNYEGGFWGLTNARRALGGSRNIPAIKAYFLAGEEDDVLDTAERLGAPTPKLKRPADGYGPTLAIGSAETPLLEMIQGYATLADAGVYKPILSIRKITGPRGTLLPLPAEYTPDAEGTEVIDPRIAYEVTSILSDPSARPGDYWRNMLTIPGTEAAAKTGTSNKCLERDDKENCIKRKPDNTWTMGYTPNIVTGVWVGNATAEAMSDKADGLNVAAPIWKEFMTKAQKILKTDTPSLPTSFRQPDGIVSVQISLLSGQLATECTPVNERSSDIFLSENAPTQPDSACVQLLVDKATGLLASDSCPTEAQEQRSFFDPHSILAKTYPSWEKGVLDWAHGIQNALEPGTTGSGAALPLPLAPTEKCDISKTPGRLDKPSVQFTSPSNGGSATYPSFQPKLNLSVASSIREVRYEIDGKLVTRLMSAPFQGVAITVPRSVAKSGTHELTVTVTDQYYNTATDTVSLSFQGDASAPSIRFLSPSADAPLSAKSETSIVAEASDPEGDVKYVEFFVNDTLLTRKPKSPFSFSYKLPEGSHTLRAVATDLAGNTAEDRVQVTVNP